MILSKKQYRKLMNLLCHPEYSTTILGWNGRFKFLPIISLSQWLTWYVYSKTYAWLNIRNTAPMKYTQNYWYYYNKRLCCASLAVMRQFQFLYKKKYSYSILEPTSAIGTAITRQGRSADCSLDRFSPKAISARAVSTINFRSTWSLLLSWRKDNKTKH